MRKLYTIFLTVALTSNVFAQAPQKMSYQAVIRNSSDALVTNHAVGMKISILKDAIPVYVETQTPTTNANGLVTIEIGGGTPVTGTFAGIDWSAGTYFIKTETDPSGGTTYTITGTSQLLSVPYSLYALNANNLSLTKDSRPSDLYIKDDGLLVALPKISVEKPYSLVPTVTDADGNTYSTVKIGTQIWIGENLKTTKYNDGTSIPLVTDDIAWTALTTPAYCWYNNDVGNKNTYGALYNWYTVNTNKLCPIGWHVPTDAEWITITIYLGSLVTGRLKESGTTHWQMPNTDAINDSKFTALPGGIRQFNETVFQRIGEIGSWWSSDKYNNGNVDLGSSRSICNSLGDIFEVNINIFVEGNAFGSGLSIRCLKD